MSSIGYVEIVTSNTLQSLNFSLGLHDSLRLQCLQVVYRKIKLISSLTHNIETDFANAMQFLHIHSFLQSAVCIAH